MRSFITARMPILGLPQIFAAYSRSSSMNHDTKQRDTALIDLGAASVATKGNLIVKEDTDPGRRSLMGGLSRDD